MAVQPTPSWLRSYAVIFTSLLAGASVVHNILKPDLTIPDLEKLENSSAEEDGSSQQVEMTKPATT
ncbi:hypothetical protein MPTK1_3g13830 [Marchantia polymorpha subsp. ruderalis]|uniref:Uncharacterized protein n=2 Tax=Marchantia polymorpha TaxID=3197 RepID=A0AAF6B0I6_MARPO|nr:hypothetical protein MARPO_0004s0288 [Marchantia polymorpha]BBN05520.1 hypothetical protein Mp_3g13830 [Marchantia polymorpha subsp. ruderalis]|eukprot:PTQ49064.1 hypothetical protein MARPO_0004s0288 [Marchantia polymorpha]